jgi:hypothetical protein
MAEQKMLSIPWAEKKKEVAKILGEEEIIGRTWDIGEDLLFFYIMLYAMGIT